MCNAESDGGFRIMLVSLYAAAIFLSAFLLFQVQPIMGKFILPWFGGTPAVWTTCMLFFQMLLMAGYCYAHLSLRWLRPRVQALVHLTLLLVMLLWLPITPSERWRPLDPANPIGRILGLLASRIGLPFFLLSATTPLLQGWFSKKFPARVPYRLYALSNAGSMVALGSYPFLVEPALPLSAQAEMWSWACVIFALLCASCATSVFLWATGERTLTNEARLPESSGPRPDLTSHPKPAKPLLWFALSACAATMLLATTNQMCLDVAVVPFLWVLPLALYLLTFVVCFAKDSWYSRKVYGAMLIVATVQACIVLHQGVYVRLPLQIASYSFTLFACCMVCHGELSRLKPLAERLTSYYLVISAGGVASGILVTLVAPVLFRGYWEFHLGLSTTCLLILIVLFRDEESILQFGRPVWVWALLLGGFCALTTALGLQIHKTFQNKIAVSRNFYGVLRVREEDRGDPNQHRYTLMHGRIEHGFQFRDARKRYWPTSYYGPNSGLGMAITLHPRRLAESSSARNLRIGVVGLGNGTIASYGEKGDYIRFYEINPEVVRFSDSYFTYRKDTEANVDVVLGDARISMEREMPEGGSQQFDVLAVDAFTSDAIPVHLLTEECFRIYWYHLREDGILAVHISSRYFDLSPVARVSALLSKGRGVNALLIRTEGSDSQGTDASDWLLATNNRQFLDSEAVQMAAGPWPQNKPAALLWTDDYTNLFAVLKPIFH